MSARALLATWAALLAGALALTLWHEPPPPGAEGICWQALFATLAVATIVVAYAARRLARTLARLPVWSVVLVSAALAASALWADLEYGALDRACIVRTARGVVYFPEVPTGRLAALIARSGGSREKTFLDYNFDTVTDALLDPEQEGPRAITTAQFVVVEGWFSLSMMLAFAVLLARFVPAVGEAPPREPAVPVAAAGGGVDGAFVGRLARVLAELYPRLESSRRIAGGADLDVAGIHFDAAAVDNWYNILDFAKRHGKLGAVVALAQEEFPAREELQRAAEALARRSVSPLLPASVAAAGAVQVSIARLPVTAGVLFGREGELAWLDACWSEGVGVASVVAFGGVGKSALVNRWLATMRDARWRGAARVFGWSFYSQGTDKLSSSDEFVAWALRELGDPEPTLGSPWDKGERLAKLVRRERTILVLDGLEPLQWGPGVEPGKLKDAALEALVKELGAQNRGLCIITTRIAVADLESMGGDRVRALHLDHLSAEAGAELLTARGAKGSDVELQEAAREYDGHSLALTLLGTYLRKAHKGDVRKRDLIPPMEGRPAHRMMARYEGWFANKPELAILRMLGLFDRPATEEEIAALRKEPPVAGLTDRLAGMTATAWNEAVTTLRDVGLLAAGAEGDERLDAHPLVREHFGEQLRREKPKAWREGHRRLYEHLRATAKELPDTVEEMAPLYAAVVHGCLAWKNQEALDEVYWKRIARTRELFDMKKLGAFGSEVAVLSAFFDPPWAQLAPGLSEADQAFVMNQAGSALRALGRLPEAAGLIRLSLEQLIAREEWEKAATCASNLSELLQSRGEQSQALEQAWKSVAYADKSGVAFRRLYERTTMATVLHAMGRREEAAAQFEEAEGTQKEDQPAYPRLYSVQGFRYCDLLLDRGRDAEVRERAAQAMTIAERNHWLLDIALNHLSLGRAHLLAVQRGAAGDLAHAASHLAQAVDGLRRAGHQHNLPLGLLAHAALRTHTRDFPAARHDLDEALALATRCGFRLHEADAHLAYARLALADPASPTDARTHLAAARTIITATGYHRRDEELAELTAACA